MRRKKLALFFEVLANANGLYLNGVLLTNTPATAYATPIILSSNSTFTQSGVGNYTISGIISGAFGIISDVGLGNILTLAGANTYTGGTTLESGTLSITSQSNIGTGSLIFSGNSTLSLPGVAGYNLNTPWVINAGVTATLALVAAGPFPQISGNISGSGTITVQNYGLTFSGNNSGFTGTFNGGSAGSQIFSSTSAAFSSGTLNTVGFRLNATGGGTYNFGAIPGINYAGINSGVAGTHIVSVGSLNTNMSWLGIVSNGTGIVGITKVGSGTLTLTGANTYSGNTTISAGTLELSTNGGLGTSPTVSIAAGATLALAHTTTNYTYAGNITGAGTINKTGTNDQTIFSGDNSGFSGTVNISNGNLRLSGATAGSASAKFFISGGALQGNTSDTFNLGELSATGGSITRGGSFTPSFVIGALNTSTTCAGTFLATISIIKVGSGTLTLTGANTHTLGNTVNSGILRISGATSLGTGATTVNSGGTLTYTVNTTGTRTVTVNAGGVINKGGFAHTGTTFVNNGGTINV